MRIIETPTKANDLGLIRRLAEYGSGASTWRGSEPLGDGERAECRRLHVALIELIDRVMAPMLDRVNAREMKTFTLHDAKHGLKVSHLMWEIMCQPRRERLTPPEIALLVLSAHLHNLGMGMSTEERRDRLEPDSDLWLKLDATGGYQHALSAIKASIEAGGLDEKSLASAIDQVAEAEDALLCQDIRERHATPRRYGELLNEFRRLHRESGRSVPSVDEALRFFDDNSKPA